jgi:phage baseplate assembly protein W
MGLVNRLANRGVCSDVRPAAILALLDMTAERRRPARLDYGSDLSLVVGQSVALSSAKSVAEAAENVSQL